MSIAQIGGALALIATIGTGTAGWYGLKTDVAENTDARLINTYERLTAIRGHRRLSQIEWLKWCDAGRRLGVFKVCPRR